MPRFPTCLGKERSHNSWPRNHHRGDPTPYPSVPSAVDCSQMKSVTGTCASATDASGCCAPPASRMRKYSETREAIESFARANPCWYHQCDVRGRVIGEAGRVRCGRAPFRRRLPALRLQARRGSAAAVRSRAGWATRQLARRCDEVDSRRPRGLRVGVGRVRL